MEGLGRSLAALCTSARTDLILAAPFVKRHVVEMLLSQVSAGVRVVCITRWLPQEIAAKVSDLSVWELFREEEQRTLLLRQDLHAKYYRADNSCLIGSANLTSAALGYGPAPNLEILLEVPADLTALVEFERRLLNSAIEVDDEIVARTAALVAELPPVLALESPETLWELGAAGEEAEGFESWLPSLRYPEDLYPAYRSEDEDLSDASRGAALADLAMLRVPGGLDGEPFRQAVGGALLRMPIVRAVDEFIVSSRRFGEVRDFLASQLPGTDLASRRWQGLLRWMIHFLPDRYEYQRPRHSEVIVRRGSAAGGPA